MKAGAWWFGALALCTVAASVMPACGDDDDDNTSTENGGGGSGGSSGKAGASGKASAGKSGSSAAGKSGSAGKGGTAAAVVCGGETCKVNSILSMINPAAKACCTDDDQCGQLNSAGKCLLNAAPGTADTSCPDVVVSLGGTDYPQKGCCTPQGQCGGNFEQVGFGCVPRAELQADMGGPLDAISCGGGSDNDAGTDAGS